MSLPDVGRAEARVAEDKSAANAQEQLLLTKLYKPRPHADIVSRPRLHARLDRALSVPLTLVVAPAGFGKTTAVVQWLHNLSHPVAWLSLDTDDTDPITFLRYLVGALRTVAPHIGETMMALLNAPQPPQPETLVSLLINDLAALTQPLLLVLDDYHVLQTAQAHQLVRRLVERLPPHVHVILTTREDPPLALSRLRARRQLVELRASDLRFTPDEAKTFLREVKGLVISAEHVVALEARTEGWIAALHLVALALEERRDVANFVANFTGNYRFIVDYLVEEVVARLPQHLRDFMVQISVLDRFCASLCDALVLGETSDSSYSQLLIDQLSSMNLFVISLDDERRWFRFHHLFGDVLRGYLSIGTTQTMQPQLYQRASKWCESQNLITEALSYAFRGSDVDRAATLLERHADSLMMQGGPATTLDWMAKLPRATIEAHPNLAVKYVSVLVFTDRFTLATSLLDAVEPDMTANDPNRLAEQAATWRTMIALMTEEPAATTIAEGERAFSLMAERNTAWGRINSLILGCGYAESGDDKTALAIWRAAVAHCQVSGDGLIEANTVAHIGRVLTYQGRLRESEATLHDLINRADAPYLHNIPTKGYALAMAAWSLYERNELERARAYAVEAIELCKYWSMPRIILHAYVMLAYIEQQAGNTEAAHHAIEQSLGIIERNQLRQTFVPVAAHQARLWLMQGDLESAAAWAQRWQSTVREPMNPAYHVEYLTLARVLAAQQRFEEAEQLLAQSIAQAEERDRTKRVIEGYALQALVASAQRDSTRALTALAFALSLGEPEACIRTFVDEGPSMAALLHQARERGIHTTYCTQLLAAFPNESQATVSPVSTATSLHLYNTGLPEPLNQRELEVLRLIAQGLSNQEIASKLVVSHSTVKWHINHLYSKLGVNTRTQALALSRELGLLLP